MSIRIMSAVWDESPYEHSLLLVHLALADAANDEGYCWPAVKSIAKKCRLDERYTRRLLNQMVEDGFVEKAVNEGKRGTNVYLVRSTPVKKDTLGKNDRGVNFTKGADRPGEGRVSRPPEPSVEPSVNKNPARGTQEEIEAFCVSLGLPASDGKWFFFKCEGNGWKNGGEPIKNWKMTIRAWQAAGHMASQKAKNGRPVQAPSIPVPRNGAPKPEDYR